MVPEEHRCVMLSQPVAGVCLKVLAILITVSRGFERIFNLR